VARRLAELTYEEVAEIFAAGRAVAIVPVGSVEPHGPHLPLDTDTTISVMCAMRAADRLDSETAAGPRVLAVVAPSVPYGVTDYASGFAGAIGVPAAALTSMLHAIATSLLATGFVHVCFVNNHLEPAHDAAVRAAIEGLAKGAASVACPLTRRWGRTLSDEFKRGDCHAGRYETSLVLAAGGHVRESFGELPTLELSLSDAIRAGKSTFAEIGMERAYTGAPREATPGEGEELYEKLVTMVVTEITEALAMVGS
jgi:creatinine amidohydrolase